jgi:alkylation response protein AidB-like acyl-CoA dehydrogenase
MAEADDLEAFRKEAADWLEANFPKSLKGRGMMMMGQGGPPVGDDAAKWRKTMGAKGWGTPTWPQRYGGGGLTPAQARVLQQEMAKAGAYNPIGGMGVMMFGPTLLEYGNEEQKTRHIPKICTGEIQWCQGYSEPGSGSDLASLQTRCEDKGDHYLVNGQKIWTSGAHTADWCFCLVRTDTTKKHEGISFILIDMKTPGVNPRPIRLINDTTPFCETFFTDVKVPKENLVGQLNGGWTIAKRLLQFERQNISGGLAGGGGGPRRARGQAAANSIEDIAKRGIGTDGQGRLADQDFRHRITLHKMENQAFGLTGQRSAMEAKSNSGPSAATSIMKYAGAKIAQERTELTIEALGNRGFGWGGEGFSPFEVQAVRGWLRAKANSIEGGTSEINLNVVSKRVLELPDPK